MVAAGLFLAGCGDEPALVDPDEPPVDAAYQPGDDEALGHEPTDDVFEDFFWLPPLADRESFTGEANLSLAPVVRVCEWGEEPCAGDAALDEFSQADGTMELEDEHYQVDWDTGETEGLEEDETYRVWVLHAAPEDPEEARPTVEEDDVHHVAFGFADVSISETGAGAQTADGDAIELVDGRTLPLKFRLQNEVTGADCELDCGEFVVTDEAFEECTDRNEACILADEGWLPENFEEDEEILFQVERVAPGEEEGVDDERCFDVAHPQDEACYSVETTPDLSGLELQAEVVWGMCQNPDIDPDHVIHQRPGDEEEDVRVLEPRPAPPGLDCGDFETAWETGGLTSLFARLARPALDLVSPEPLYARADGEAGSITGWSDFFYGPEVDLEVESAPEDPQAPEAEVILEFKVVSAHEGSGMEGEAVDGVEVKFEVGEGGLDPGAAVSDEDGIVATEWTLPEAVGEHELTASVPGRSVTVPVNVVEPDLWTGDRGEFEGVWLNDVFFTSRFEAWAVGEDGATILHMDGTDWEMNHQDENEDLALWAVHFPTEDQGWAVGGDRGDTDAQMILHTDDGGGDWNVHESPTSGRLRGVHFVDENTGWAVGSGGLILHYDGQGWEPQDGVESLLTDVHFVDEDTGWAVGAELVHTSDGGESWDFQLALEVTLQAVHFVDEDQGWAVGSGGTILHTEDGGESWVSQSSGTTVQLEDVHFVDADTGWAVGAGLPGILHTDDGGETWTEQGQHLDILDGTVLHGVHFFGPFAESGGAVGRDGTLLRYRDVIIE